jgi:hypothetical protein
VSKKDTVFFVLPAGWNIGAFFGLTPGIASSPLRPAAD